LTPGGSLELVSEELRGVPEIVTSDGWDVARLLTLLGSRPFIAPGEPMQLQGLPAGAYTISVEGHTATAEVTTAERVRASLR
jgi:hypothetical protein